MITSLILSEIMDETLQDPAEAAVTPAGPEAEEEAAAVERRHDDEVRLLRPPGHHEVSLPLRLRGGSDHQQTEVTVHQQSL